MLILRFLFCHSDFHCYSQYFDWVMFLSTGNYFWNEDWLVWLVSSIICRLFVSHLNDYHFTGEMWWKTHLQTLLIMTQCSPRIRNNIYFLFILLFFLSIFLSFSFAFFQFFIHYFIRFRESGYERRREKKKREKKRERKQEYIYCLNLVVAINQSIPKTWCQIRRLNDQDVNGLFERC